LRSPETPERNVLSCWTSSGEFFALTTLRGFCAYIPVLKGREE
jgi:hypothetical protein